MSKVEATHKSAFQPSAKVLVSCTDMQGRDNALAVGYCCNCSYDPPMVMVGIVPSRFSYSMIKEAGCFVLNLPDSSCQRMFDYLGSVSGRDEDKLGKDWISVERAKTINAPILADCPVNIECTIVDSIRTGSHEMFVGRIESVRADAQYLDEQGRVKMDADYL